MAAYVGEFIFTLGYYFAKNYVFDVEHVQSEIRFVQFCYPAICDFMGNLLFIYGLSAMLPSISMVSKAITLPLTAYFCTLAIVRINKTFNNKQIIALIAILASVLMVMLASYDLQKEWFGKDHTTGLIMLGISACFQSFEVTLENRIFNIEKDLSALAL